MHNTVDQTKAASIMEVYSNRPTRGRRQVQMQLERQYDLHMSLGSVHRYMSILDIRSKRIRKYPNKAKETQDLPRTFPNVLGQDFRVSLQPTDITFLPCRDGLLYLSCIKDLRDKSIIAYAISTSNDLQLVLDTLEKAKSYIYPGIILHSDRGVQYCSRAYHRYLQEHGMIGSMSRKANPQDNAPMESFFSTLKNEELKQHSHRSMAQTRLCIKWFIEYYNMNRPQWNLKKLTPFEFRNQLQT